MDYRSVTTTTIWWHYSNGSKELHLPLSIAEISDIMYILWEFHILINVIIIGGELWKTRFIWTIHIQCKNWRKIFEEKLPTFLLRNIFRTTRPAQMLEVGILRLLRNKVMFNCSGNTDQKILAETGFIYDKAPTTA